MSVIAASFRSDSVVGILNCVHSTLTEDRIMESTGIKLGRDKSRRRLPHDRPRFNEDGERVPRGLKDPGSDDEDPPGMRRSNPCTPKLVVVERFLMGIASALCFRGIQANPRERKV